MEPPTYFLTAGPDPSGPEPRSAVAGSVSRVIDTPPTLNVAVALAVIVFTVVEFTTTVQVAVLPTNATVALQVSLTKPDETDGTMFAVVATGVAAPGFWVTVMVNV